MCYRSEVFPDPLSRYPARMLTFDDVLRISTLLLSASPAVERKKLADLAMAAWLDTLPPEGRSGALDEAVKRLQWQLEHD